MRGRTLAALLTLLLALALAGQALRWRDRMAASRALSNVEALTLGVAAGKIPPEALAEQSGGAAPGGAARSRWRWGSRSPAAASTTCSAALEPAEQAYLEALRLEPRAEAYLDLGRAQWQAGRREEAVRNFGLAVRLEPHLAAELPPGRPRHDLYGCQDPRTPPSSRPCAAWRGRGRSR